LTSVTAIAGGGSSGYALRSDGTVWAWGANWNGGLGDGTTTDSRVPVHVSGLTSVTAIGAGAGSGYAVRSDGTVWAWGMNNSGQLGNGTTTDSSVPVQVSGLTSVTAVAGGYDTAYALRSDGTVWAWGDGWRGALGNGGSVSSLAPVQVSGLTDVTTISGAFYAGHALRSDGTIWSWGDNRHAALGNGTTMDSTVPVQVSALTGATAISSGEFSAYALRSDGTVWSWGYNGYGQLGNGTQIDSSVPVQVSGLSGVGALAAGGFQAYALGGVVSLVAPVGGPVSARELPGAANPCLPCSAKPARKSVGDPVDTESGGYAETFVDLAISGRGPQAVWTRSYASATAADDGPLGFGWHTGYGAHLVVDASTGDVMVSQENGSEALFTNVDGALSAAPRVQATLTKNADGTYAFVRQTSETLTFAAGGALVSIADRNGEITTLTYAGGDLATITEPGGRALAVTYTGAHITKVSDPLNQTASYTYADAGNLASVTGPDGAVTTYGYDDAHHVISVLDPAQQSASVKHPMTMIYDAQGRVTSQTDPLGRTTILAYTGDPASDAGGSTLTTDPAGHQRLDSYQYGVRTGSVTGYDTPQAVTSVFTFDPATLGVTSTTVTSAGDPITHVSTATYNAQGRPISQVDGLGREIDTTYNSFGEPLTVTAPNPSSVGPSSITTTRTYDDAGNLLSVTRPLYTSATAFTNQVTTYERGTTPHPQDVTAIVDALGKRTVNTYSATGDLISTTSSQGRKSTFTYDGIGRRLTAVAPKGNATGANPAQFTTTYTYDGAGRVLSTSVATATTPLVSSTTYDADGRALTETDPLGQVTTVGYDLAGEPILETRPDGSTRASTYWPDGTLKTQVDGKNRITSYAEDALGRVASVTDPLNRATTYTHDATGAVLTITEPQGQVTTNTYDAAEQLASTDYSDTGTHSAVRTYNAAGLPATLVDGTGTTTFTYDSLGRLTSQAAPGGTVKYAYNLRGQVTTMTYPNAKTVTNTYEADGALTSVKDWLSKTTTFTYDQNEAWTGDTTPNGVATTIARDNPGRVTSFTVAKGATTLGKLVYAYDAASQITSETSTSLGPSRTFTNDTVGRMTKENTVVYAYDAADELTTNGATTQNYDAAGQLTTTVTGSTSTAYVFDARGNRTKATTGSTVTSYGYDQANRLTSYTKGATAATYAYNGDGLRVSKTVAGTTTNFVYDTAEGMPLILNDGANSYLYGPGRVPFEQITTAGVANYLHADQLGSIRMITNTSGANSGTVSYTAYGVPTKTGTTSAFGYAGQYTDAESGLQWDRARYYDPVTGQFLTVDLLTATSRARYSYAGGNPITGADPTGLIDWSQALTIAAAAALVVFAVCVIAEPCGAIGGGIALAAGGAAGLGVTVSAGAITSAAATGVGAGLMAGSIDIALQNANGGSGGGANCDPAGANRSLDDLLSSGEELDPADAGGQLTRAGRALAKASEVFGKTSGSPSAINAAGQEALKEILTNPGTVKGVMSGGHFAGGVRFVSPGGMGAVFGPDGTFEYFGWMR
jgi:RHS repeat-associated protein